MRINPGRGGRSWRREFPPKISKRTRSNDRGYLADTTSTTRLSRRIPPVALLDVCREGTDGLEGAALRTGSSRRRKESDSDFRREFRPIQAHPGEAAFNHSIAAAWSRFLGRDRYPTARHIYPPARPDLPQPPHG